MPAQRLGSTHPAPQVSESPNPTRRRPVRLALFGLAFLLIPHSCAWGYIGPGAGFAFLGSILGILSALFAGALALILIPLRLLLRRSFIAAFLILAAVGLLAYWGSDYIRRKKSPPADVGDADPPGSSELKIVILGFDGMDPRIVESLWNEGSLPNLRRLAGSQGMFRLGTTAPPASPVAWSTFATGLEPHEHGINDFLIFDPHTRTLEFSMAKISPPQKFLHLRQWQFPLDSPKIRSFRRGVPFWTRLHSREIPSVVLRVPVTFPPDPSTRMLSGMGVPDLRGTQGWFVYYTNDAFSAATDAGDIVEVHINDGSFEADMVGPPSPYLVRATPAGSAPPAPHVPASPTPALARFTGKIDERDGSIELDVQGRRVTMRVGQWSELTPVVFRFGMLSYAEGLVKFYLKSLSPVLGLYQSPIQMDPRAPSLPISVPFEYAAKLSRDIGLYHTAGMPEETWGLNAGILGDEAFLEQAMKVHEERRRMFEKEFSDLKSGLLACVFDSPDRISHMFWRFVDPGSADPRATDTARLAVRRIYERMDDVVGWTMDRMDSTTHLIVLSDHGFSSFRRSVHLNALLHRGGFLHFEDPFSPSGGEFFDNIDWTRTTAFAAGLNGLYLNSASTSDGQRSLLLAELKKFLRGVTDPKTGRKVIRNVFAQDPNDGPDLIVGYDEGFRASWQTALGATPAECFEDNLKKWSGDHLVDPELVPGILLTDLAVDVTDPHLRDIAPAVLNLLAPGEPDANAAAPRLKGRKIFRITTPSPDRSPLPRD